MGERLGIRVSKNIKRFRQVADLTQEGLAERMGVTVRYVSALEQNPGNLNLRTLQRIADALEVDVADLVADPAASKDVRIAAAEKAIDILREYIRAQR
jgi:transcriptional regulator with XRE-family HTH domain